MGTAVALGLAGSTAVRLLSKGELMVTNALRAYLQLATGLTEVTKQKATDAAKQLSAQLGVQGDEAIATAGAVATIASQQIQVLTEDLLAAAKSNRKLLSDLVQVEVDRGATQLASKLDPQQLEGLLAAVRRLADEIAALTGVSRGKAESAAADAAPAHRTTATDARPLASKKPAKKTAPAAKKTAEKSTAQKATTAKSAAAKKPPVKKVPSKKPDSTQARSQPADSPRPPAKAAEAPAAVTESINESINESVREPVLELVPEPVIDLDREPKIDPKIDPAIDAKPADSSPESNL